MIYIMRNDGRVVVLEDAARTQRDSDGTLICLNDDGAEVARSLAPQCLRSTGDHLCKSAHNTR